MPSSTPSPDKFQREIDDVIRLAERRLQRKSPGYRIRRALSRLVANGGAGPRFGLRIPPPEVLAGWGLALMLLSWLFGLLSMLIRVAAVLVVPLQVAGIALLVAGLILSLMNRGGARGSGPKTWRGERISYGNPYGGGADVMRRLRRLFRR